MKGVLTAALHLLPLSAAPDSSGPSRSRLRGFAISSRSQRVILFDRKGREQRRIECAPYDAQALTGGRVLVTERSAGRVAIFDAKDRCSWERTGLSSPSDAEALPNGNILVLENGAGRVVEFDAAGREVWQVGGLSNPYDVDRLPNGNTLVADSGNNRIVEFDRNGLVVFEKRGLDFPNSVARRSDGRTLFTTYTRGGVAEMDRSGAITWEVTLEGSTLFSVFHEGSFVWVSDGTAGRAVKLSRRGEILEEVKFGSGFVDLHYIR